MAGMVATITIRTVPKITHLIRSYPLYMMLSFRLCYGVVPLATSTNEEVDLFVHHVLPPMEGVFLRASANRQSSHMRPWSVASSAVNRIQ